MSAALALLVASIVVPVDPPAGADAPGVAEPYSVSLAVGKPEPITVAGKPTPNFDTDVLVPLRAAQAKAEAERQAREAEAARLAALEAARAAEAARVAQQSAPVSYAAPAYAGAPTDLMAAAGISPSDYGYVDFIVNHEGGWNGVTRYNTGGSGAYGLCQALPGNKMAAAGADWATNPVTQLRWCSSYAASRYGSWSGAYAAWIRQNWW